MRLLENIKTILNRVFYLEIDRLPEQQIDCLPTKLWDFIWFFLRQIKGFLGVLLFVEFIVAGLGSLVFWYVGELVDRQEYDKALALGGIMLLVFRQVSIALIHALYDFVFTPYFGNMVRRQLYWFTARQSLSYFQNDFAGRIANKLLQAPSLSYAVRSTIGSVWFVAIFTVTNLVLMAQVELYLALPLAVWLISYIVTLFYFIPKVQSCSKKHADAMSTLTGQIVDGLTNFLPTKYFARSEYEDQRVISLLRQHGATHRKTTGTIWAMGLVIDILNVLLLIATAAVCFWMIEQDPKVGVPALAMALPMALQATFQSGWIMFEVSAIFENLGTVQDIIETLSKPQTVKDKKQAAQLMLPKGQEEIRYEKVFFNYDEEGDRSVIQDFTLTIPAGQKVGLVGRSGAGKSTIISLLVRAHDLADGSIKIGGQNIADVTQDSLREKITVVTQDSYLFHRSVLENIQYGDLTATMPKIVEAAKQAYAYDFIQKLQDNQGRKAFDAHIGERGVKLSGGQRQRVGIARAILKNAPILILDEATSALDSESEQAIQKALETVMEGKTVIAIAHRLSTLRQMDRILVMDHGCIIEDGTHADLIKIPDGHYAALWQMQSGGFILED